MSKSKLLFTHMLFRLGFFRLQGTDCPEFCVHGVCPGPCRPQWSLTAPASTATILPAFVHPYTSSLPFISASFSPLNCLPCRVSLKESASMCKQLWLCPWPQWSFSFPTSQLFTLTYCCHCHFCIPANSQEWESWPSSAHLFTPACGLTVTQGWPDTLIGYSPMSSHLCWAWELVIQGAQWGADIWHCDWINAPGTSKLNDPYRTTLPHFLSVSLNFYCFPWY